MDNDDELEVSGEREQETVAPERLVTLPLVAERLGITPEQLRELARRGELPAGLDIGHLLVEEVQPVEVQPLSEQLVAGTTRQRARMAQRVALDHLFERLVEPVVPQRSI